MYVKSSPPQQNAVVEAGTADILVLGQALYNRAILPPVFCVFVNNCHQGNTLN